MFFILRQVRDGLSSFSSPCSSVSSGQGWAFLFLTSLLQCSQQFGASPLGSPLSFCSKKLLCPVTCQSI